MRNQSSLWENNSMLNRKICGNWFCRKSNNACTWTTHTLQWKHSRHSWECTWESMEINFSASARIGFSIDHKLTDFESGFEVTPLQLILDCAVYSIKHLEVPGFSRKIIFSDEAHFWINVFVNKQNCDFWSNEKPLESQERPFISKKLPSGVDFVCHKRNRNSKL